MGKYTNLKTVCVGCFENISLSLNHVEIVDDELLV